MEFVGTFAPILRTMRLVSLRPGARDERGRWEAAPIDNTTIHLAHRWALCPQVS
jgi:hypothetical protein